MSDSLWGVIIGGGIALLVAVISYIVQGIFSLKNIRIQSEVDKANRYEERLILNRAKYLEPLRDMTVQCCEKTINLTEKIVDLTAENGVSNKNNSEKFITQISDKEKFENEVEQLRQICIAVTNETRKLLPFTYVTSDHNLSNKIFDVLDLSSDVGANFLNAILEYKIRVEKENISELDLTSVIHDYAHLLALLHGIIFIVEELMSGLEVSHDEKEN